jgi:nitrogen regulatory protein P-II 1
MIEIKAYVRIIVLQDVVEELNRAEFRCISIIDVAGLGELIDPKDWKYSMEFIEKTSEVAKLEVVSAERDADMVVNIIREHGRTNQSGDGMIYVSPVVRAVKIRTGEEGREFLQKQSGKGIPLKRRTS